VFIFHGGPTGVRPSVNVDAGGEAILPLSREKYNFSKVHPLKMSTRIMINFLKTLTVMGVRDLYCLEIFSSLRAVNYSPPVKRQTAPFPVPS
jgi:hypothetical protein